MYFTCSESAISLINDFFLTLLLTQVQLLVPDRQITKKKKKKTKQTNKAAILDKGLKLRCISKAYQASD